MADMLKELFVSLGLKDELSGKLSTVVTAMSAVTVGVSALSNAIQGPIDAFNKLESASMVTALQTGRTKEEMMGLIEGLHSVDTTMQESIDLFTALGRAGVDSEEELKLLGDQFDSLGDATGKSGASMAETLIPAMKALGEEATNVDFDKLTVMFMETNVSAEEFGAAIKRIGPDLQEVGLTFEDVEKAMVAMEEQGIEGRKAISTLNEVFAKNKEAAEAVIEAQEDLEDASKNLIDAQEELADANERLLDSNDSYADSSDRVTSAENDLAEAKLKLAEVQKDQESSSLDILKAQNDVTEASNKLASAHRDQADAGREVVKTESELKDATEGVKTAQMSVEEATKKLTEAQKLGVDANKDGKVSAEELEKALGLEAGSVEEAGKKLDASAGKMDEYAAAQAEAIPKAEQFNVWMEKIGVSLGGALQPLEGIVGPIGGIAGALSGLATPILLCRL